MGSAKRRVLAVTGIRSEYFLQRSILQAIAAHPCLTLEVVVTGAHLSPLHGGTVREIERDGFPIAARLETLLDSDRDAGRLKGAALQLQSLAQVVDDRRPDWLLAPADREEAMTTALCGAYLNIATAHYGAGDRVVGNVDDMVRHAVSRLAHLLLTTHEAARERLIRAGEQPWRVHCVGHSGLDRIQATPELSPDALAAALNVSRIDRPYLVVIQHPLSSEVDAAEAQMRETLEAIVAVGWQAFVIYPNTDAGSRGIIRVIDEYGAGGQGKGKIYAFNTIPDVPFVNLLRGALALVGNSSLGILEAPLLRLPAINVGNRQQGRLHAENVLFVPPDRKAITAALRRIADDEDFAYRLRDCANPFGDGHTGARVAELLATIPLDAKLLNKDLQY